MAGKKKAAKKKAARRKAPGKAATADDFKVERGWLNKSDMAAGLGISVQAFDRWGVKPVAQRHAYGEAFYRPEDVLANRLANQAKRLERPESEMEGFELAVEKERAEIALKKEQAEGHRLKNAAMRRELAPVEMIQWALSQAGSQIAAVLGTVKGKVKRAQPELSNAALHVVEQMVVETQNIAADIRLDWDEFDAADLADPRSD